MASNERVHRLAAGRRRKSKKEPVMKSLEMTRRSDLRMSFLIQDVSRLIRAAYSAQSERFNVSPLEYRLLTEIAERIEAASQTEIARAIGIGKVAVGEVAAGLERKRLIVRRSCANNRRAYHLELMPQGRYILATISTALLEIHHQLFVELSLADRQIVVDTLLRIKAKVGSDDPPRLPTRARSGCPLHSFEAARAADASPS
jgi:DNA-binding MarR family transcriptional regulator